MRWSCGWRARRAFTTAPSGDAASCRCRAQRYIDGLTVKDFAGIEGFFAREAHRYAVSMEQPVHVELYPQGSELPPALAPEAGPFGVAWWSLKLRWFAAHATKVSGRAPPRVRILVLHSHPSDLGRAHVSPHLPT